MSGKDDASKVPQILWGTIAFFLGAACAFNGQQELGFWGCFAGTLLIANAVMDWLQK